MKENKQLRAFTINVYIELIAGILFSLFSLSFHGDVSLIAFPLSLLFTAATVYFTYFKMLKKINARIILKLESAKNRHDIAFSTRVF